MKRMMKKHTLLISNLIIIFFIVVGFLAVVYKNTRTYQGLAEEHLENIVSLANTDISKYIENTMDKPVMVSKTMANDEFLKTWLQDEPKYTDNEAYLNQLYSYLKAYQVKYDYTTVFCISDRTGNYYYQDGLNKTISRDNGHDIWYYNFTDSGQEHDLEVDTNEENNGDITIFVNFRVTGEDNSLLGVIGVGLEVTSIEDIVQAYEDKYDLSVFVINAGGAENSFSGSTDLFVDETELAARTGITDGISFNETDESVLQWFTLGGERKCLVTKYDQTLGWYLILEKDINSITGSFQQSIKGNIVFMLIPLSACVFATSIVFAAYNRRLIVIENTDELTGLANRKLFKKRYPALLRKYRKQKLTMFMLDIDHFKTVNDTRGHMFGNAVLSMVGVTLRNAVDGKGTAARWGGDEFLGILAVEPEEAERILRGFMDTLRDEKNTICYPVTVSVGVAEIRRKQGMDQMFKKVDEALYASKNAGRDRITIL